MILLIKLYTTHCPKCKVLEMKLMSKNIEYQECTDEKEMVDKNILSVPVLEIDGKYLNFSEANTWINGVS